MRDGEALENRREHVRRHRRRGPEREAPGPPALERVHDAPPVGEAVDRLDGVREERLARLGQPHAARRPYEEARPEVLLQPLEPRRERGLRQEERGRRPADVPGPRDLDERFDLGQEHDRSSLYPGSKETIW
jgi:hypothetical protein